MEHNMKYIVVLGDGMSDYRISELGNKTPLEKAYKPNMDYLSENGELGLVKTVPEKFSPGSDVANLSVMGYDVDKYYTGRSPLEAISMGIELKENEVTMRCNLVTLKGENEYENMIMHDYSSDEISTEESTILINELKKHFDDDIFTLYSGISYRHCLVSNETYSNPELTPPHDISGKPVTNYLPDGDNTAPLLSMMKKSYEILRNHEINKKRIKNGLNPANSMWLWGMGTKPVLPDFYKKYGLKGSVISAVDLIKGIGIAANMKIIEVEGATGNIHTNFKGKGKAAIETLRNDSDFVFIHVEAPDECGHRKEIENKVKAIELIDKEIVGPIINEFKDEDFKIMVLPDHATPLSLMTHTKDPVPYIIYDNKADNKKSNLKYTEENAIKTGLYLDKGHTIMDRFLIL
jgi:2,3-bisphosphoglycerate-independent phosphoglycerate mutase